MIDAAQNAAKSAAEDTAVIPVLNTIKLKSDIVDIIGEERIDRSIIRKLGNLLLEVLCLSCDRRDEYNGGIQDTSSSSCDGKSVGRPERNV